MKSTDGLHLCSEPGCRNLSDQGCCVLHRNAHHAFPDSAGVPPAAVSAAHALPGTWSAPGSRAGRPLDLAQTQPTEGDSQ